MSPPCAGVLSPNAFAFKGPGKAGSGSRAGNVLDVPETRKLSKLLNACQKVSGVSSRVTDQKWETQTTNNINNSNGSKHIN